VCCVNERDDGRQPDLTPEINLAKGLLGRRGSAIIQYIQDFHRRRSEAYVQEVLAASGMESDDIAGVIGGNEPLAEMLGAGWDAAAHTASDYKVRLLANVVAQALTDPVRIDIAQLRLQTFRELEEQHVHGLALLAVADEQRPAPSYMDQMVDALDHLDTAYLSLFYVRPEPDQIRVVTVRCPRGHCTGARTGDRGTRGTRA
jgi:hypothetical protein